MEQFRRESSLPPGAVKSLYKATTEAVDRPCLRGEVDATVHDSPFVRVWRKGPPRALQARSRPLLAPTTSGVLRLRHSQGGSGLRAVAQSFHRPGTKPTAPWSLLKHRYLVEMTWLGIPLTREIAMSKAQLLLNQFLSQKQEMLERKRQEAMKTAGARY